MSKTTFGFILTSFAYLTIGATLGVLFFIFPETRALRTVHAHINLVGFVSFLIFGIAYHILPRFKGRPLHSEGIAWWQFWLANIGLVGLSLFLGWGAYQPLEILRLLQALLGAVLLLSVYLFVYNMFRTLV